MAVTSVKWISDGAGGGSDYRGHGEVVRTARVTVDDKTDDELIVLGNAGIPKVFDAHPTLWFLLATEARADREHGAYTWIVKVTYKSELPDQETAAQNPNDRGWIDEYRPITDTEPAVYGYLIDESGIEATELSLIGGSAGESFDPPSERRASRLGMKFVKPVLDLPSWFVDVQDVINDADMTIRGKTYPKSTLIANVAIGRIRTDNALRVRDLELTIEYYKRSWHNFEPDRGFNYKKSGKFKKITINGSEPQQPPLLNGAGFPLGLVDANMGAAGSITSGTPDLTCIPGSFTADDVGKEITVYGAGTSGDLVTTILAVTNAFTATLAANADTTVDGATVAWTTKPHFRRHRKYDYFNFGIFNLPP